MPAAMAMPANDVKSQRYQTYGASMCRIPTDTSSRMPVRIGTTARPMHHFASSVCQRLMAIGMLCRHFGPISVVP